jgi:hypothetical protein
MLPRRFIPFLILLLVVRVSPVVACLNDTDVSSGEDEFRSRYDEGAGKDATAPSNVWGTRAINPWGVAAVAAGSGLAAASLFAGGRRKHDGK